MKVCLVACVTSLTALMSSVAFAQDGELSASASASGTGMGLPGQAADGTSDHARVVGHMGVGYLGRRTMSIASPAGGGGAPIPVSAPVIGVRYWMDSQLGLDLGVGLSMTTGSTEVNGTEADKVGASVLILHGGVPLALASSGHFTFQVVPELNLGLATATEEFGGGVPDNSLFGWHLDIGARAGAEVHFGFIDIPNLSLQGGVGLALVHEYVSASNYNASTPDEEFNDSTLTFGTSLNGDPWHIFTGSISALYYF